MNDSDPTNQMEGAGQPIVYTITTAMDIVTVELQ